MKVGIVGQGFVGSAVFEGFKKHFNVETFDLNKKSTCSNYKNLYINQIIFLFVYLPQWNKQENVILGFYNL